MKKSAVFIVLLALPACFAEVDKKGKKRGVFGDSLGLGYPGYNSHHALSLDGGHGFDSHDFSGQDFGSSQIGAGHVFGGSSHHGPIDLGSSAHQHITITKKVGIPVPQPYPVHVEKKIPVPVPHAVPYPVDKPYPVHVPEPYTVPVDKPVPYTVVKHTPYPVKVEVKVPVKVPVAEPYPEPYPVTVHKKVPIHVPEPYIVKKYVPVFIKSHDQHGIDGSRGFSLGGHNSFEHGHHY